eukprot:4390198-Amphidinium_carterae.1
MSGRDLSQVRSRTVRTLQGGCALAHVSETATNPQLCSLTYEASKFEQVRRLHVFPFPTSGGSYVFGLLAGAW